jgi:enamine deaminase RidA (YjgF/YER057c/UK114 family)
MKTQYLNPTALYEPRFFTHAVSIEDGDKLVFVSGQVSYDRDGIVMGKGDVREQCEQVFKSLSHALRAAGASWSDVVKMNGYMVDMAPAALNVFREVRARYLDGKRMPASTLVGVERLVHEDLMLEVELVAAVSRKKAKPAKPAKKRSKAR